MHFTGKRLELGPHTTTEEVRLSEVDEAGENLALSSGRPLFPLPRGRIGLHFCSFSMLSVFVEMISCDTFVYSSVLLTVHNFVYTFTL